MSRLSNEILGKLLELSAVLYLGALLLGLVVFVQMLRWLLKGRSPVPSLPAPLRLQNPALDSMLSLLDKLKASLPQTPPQSKSLAQADIQALDRTVEEVRDRCERMHANLRNLLNQRAQTHQHMQRLEQEFSRPKQLKFNPDFQFALERFQELNALVDSECEFIQSGYQSLLRELRSRSLVQRHWHLLEPPSGAAASGHEEAEAWEDEIFDDAAHPINKPAPNGLTEEEWQGELPPPPTAEPSQESTSEVGEPAKPVERTPMHQAEFPSSTINLKARHYQDSSFELSFAEKNRLEHYDFSQCDFTSVHFKGVHNYRHCRFQQGVFFQARFEREHHPHRFDACDFSASDWEEASLNSIAFYDCDFGLSRWTGASLQRVKFVRCRFDQADLQGVDLSRVAMSPDMLDAIDFSAVAKLPLNHPQQQKSQQPTSIKSD